MIDKKEYIFGLRAVIEAIEAGKDIDRVLIRKDLAGETWLENCWPKSRSTAWLASVCPWRNSTV